MCLWARKKMGKAGSQWEDEDRKERQECADVYLGKECQGADKAETTQQALLEAVSLSGYYSGSTPAGVGQRSARGDMAGMELTNAGIRAGCCMLTRISLE